MANFGIIITSMVKARKRPLPPIAGILTSNIFNKTDNIKLKTNLK